MDDRDKIIMLETALSAAKSKEVCTEPHDDKVLEFCPYCKIEYYEQTLDKLAKLGNEPHLGNSDGNMLARRALKQYA